MTRDRKKNYLVLEISTGRDPNYGDLTQVVTREAAEATVARLNRFERNERYGIYKLSRHYWNWRGAK